MDCTTTHCDQGKSKMKNTVLNIAKTSLSQQSTYFHSDNYCNKNSWCTAKYSFLVDSYTLLSNKLKFQNVLFWKNSFSAHLNIFWFT